MTQSENHLPWKTIALAVLPGAIYLAARLLVAANENGRPVYWVPEVVALVAAIAVIAAALWRERRLPLWSLFATGLAAFALIAQQGAGEAFYESSL